MTIRGALAAWCCLAMLDRHPRIAEQADGYDGGYGSSKPSSGLKGT
jgi:hypothetical protein